MAGSTFAEVMGVPAWRSLPSRYLVAVQDQAIPADAERLFAGRMAPPRSFVVASGHLAMVSHHADVTQLITAAAASVVQA